MTRSLAIALVCAAGATTQAATLSFNLWGRGATSVGQNYTPPFENDFYIRNDGNPTPLAHFTVPDIQPSPNPQAFVLDASTAASYGVDWATVEDAFVNPAGKLFVGHIFGFPSVGFAGLPLNNGSQGTNHLIYFDSLDSLTFHVDHYFSSPIGSAFAARWTARGEGVIVPEPEPVAWVMLVIAAAGFAHRRWRAR